MATTLDVPGAPTGLTATASGTTMITLTWVASTNTGGSAITGYRIEISVDAGSSWEELITSQTQTTYAHTGLTANSTRYYQVFAINAQGNSIASNTANATTGASTDPDPPMDPPTDPEPSSTTVPDAPTALTITPSGRTILQLTWTAPAKDNGSAVTGYIVEVSLDENTYNELAQVTEPRYTHRGLSAGDVRTYQVRAVNSIGAGAPSDPAHGTTSSETSIPADPTHLMVTPSGRTLVELSWTAPADDGGATITGYQIDVGQASESATQAQQQASAMKRAQDPVLMWTTLIANTGSNQTRYVHRGLAPNTTRHYRVLAINSVGTSLATDPLPATTTDSSTPTIPSDPLELTATLDDPSTATLAWNAPADDGGSSLTGYRMEVAIHDATTFTELVALSQTQTTYTHTGLAPKTAHIYRVIAINAQGNSLPSNTAQVGDVLPTLSFATTASTASESDETVVLMLTESDLYRVAAPQTYTLTITDDDEAILGFVASIADQTWFQSLPMDTLTLPAAIYGRAPHIYTLTPELPAGLTFDASTRQITGTPTDITPATTYTYTVTDADEQAATQTFMIKIVEPDALRFTDTVGARAYPVQLPLTDHIFPAATGGIAPYTYMLRPDLPAGLVFDPETRTLSGTPLEVAAAQSFTYTAEDRAGTRIEQKLSLEVYQMSFASTVADQSYPRGEMIAELVLPKVMDAVSPVQYTLTLLDLPLGLRFDFPVRTIRGIPTEVTPPVEMTYEATDANGARDSLMFTIEIVSPISTEAEAGLPEAFQVHSNYPNPFHSFTHLIFDLPWPAQVQVEILDVIGRRVVAIPAVRLRAGWGHELELSELQFPSGPYLYRIQATSLKDKSSKIYVGHFTRIR